jgi:hypothetical protein
MTKQATDEQTKSPEPTKTAPPDQKPKGETKEIPLTPKRLYSKGCRGGKVFEGAEVIKALKEGWVNHPDKVK